jgi:hypothetical protein
MIQHLAQEYSYDSLTSPVACKDLINATMRAHAALNKRGQVCIDDLVFVARIQPYLTNPFSQYDGEIIRLRAKGLGVKQICKEIRKVNYDHHVHIVIKKAELRGVLSPSE